MPKAKYGVTEGRFYIDQDKLAPMVYLEYRNMRTKEIKTVTIPAEKIHEKLSVEINDFLVDIIDRYENLGGD